MKSADAWASLDVGDTDDPVVRARWLEDSLVGLELASLIDELTVANGCATAPGEPSQQSVRSWLGPDTTAVLEQGLSHLPARKIDELFRQPDLLPGLQELVLTEGGAYWDARSRANAATGAVATEHGRVLADKLWGSRSEQEHAPRAESVQTPLASNDPPTSSAGHPLPGGRAIRRALLFFTPLAVAATVLAVIALRARGPARPLVPGVEAPNPTVIVRADLPAAEPVQPSPSPSTSEGWPAHPWQALATGMPGRKPTMVEPDGRKVLSLPPGKWVAGSRDWARRLQETSNMSSAQLRAAAERAREAVTAIESLVATEDSGIQKDIASRLEATCREVFAELDQLQAEMGKGSSVDGGVTRAKQVIIRNLGEIELILDDDRDGKVKTAGEAAESRATPGSR